jgi:mannitol-specific phosphotransferase system IIBC component
MSKFLSILIATAFASASFGALAADDPAKAARKQANDTYKADKAACKPMKGDEQKNCMKQAKAKHDQAAAEIKKMKKSSKASTGASTAPAATDAAPATSGSSIK